MKKFLCRDVELSKMNRRYDSGSFECVVIYGRRRVGKTALINAFCQGKKTIYFPALSASAQENLKTLSRAIHLYQHPEGGAFPIYPDFDSAWEEIGRLGEKERVIFVIDEFPYLAKADPSISSRLQHQIDLHWQDSRLYLILCGSSMSFMQHQVLGYESPLYGRRTAQFKIEPLNYRETALFNPSLTPEENAIVYGVTGGVPHYINKLDVHGDLDSALIENVFDSSCYLFEEPENLLKQELREPGVYHSILTAIADGASRVNEIATKVGLESGSCLKYIKVLMELGILKKETPVSEKAGKKTIYQIEDCFFRFWYYFVPKNMTSIMTGHIGAQYETQIKPQLHHYMGLVFEKMCRDYLLLNNMDIVEIGQWWGNDPKRKKQVQIDIVGVTANRNESLIGSCKFRTEAIGVDELDLLRSYAEVYQPGGKFRFVIFSLGGFTEGLRQEEVQLVSLSDMYG